MNKTLKPWDKLRLPKKEDNLLRKASRQRRLRWFNTLEDIRDLLNEQSAPDENNPHGKVIKCGYDIPVMKEDGTPEKNADGTPKMKYVEEGVVIRAANAVAAKFHNPEMRRRDPNAMKIGDDDPTDKDPLKDATFNGRKYKFAELETATYAWLDTQRLIAFCTVMANGDILLFLGPENAAFFAFALALLQGITPLAELKKSRKVRGVILLAPTFRHTHFGGEQVVVHHRSRGLHEIFSFNLYPGPSAKKGVYAILLEIGEKEGWVTNHCSAVKMRTPFGNDFVIMHEGASGGGKSELLEPPKLGNDGHLHLGTNLVTGTEIRLPMGQLGVLRPVTDDMGVSHPDDKDDSGFMPIRDPERGWFIRVNECKQYGDNPMLEALMVNGTCKDLFTLSLEAVPGGVVLPDHHQEDAPGKPCPNPRVIVPRSCIPGIKDGVVRVNVRTMGVRTPPCSAINPSYGIISLIHLLSPGLAFIWRLLSLRGHDNPSIKGGEKKLISEGISTFWPFATGRRVDLVNLVLHQILEYPNTRHALIPNQHIGSYKVVFAGQAYAREWLSRVGTGTRTPDEVQPARCTLLGYELKRMAIETEVPQELLQVHRQIEVGTEGYDAGAEILMEFARHELQQYRDMADLDPLAKRIIEHFYEGGSVEGYEALIPGHASWIGTGGE